MTIEELVQEALSLPIQERKQLINRLVDTLTEGEDIPRKRSILELAGLGADIWKGIDPQEYINQLRDEWDEGS